MYPVESGAVLPHPPYWLNQETINQSNLAIKELAHDRKTIFIGVTTNAGAGHQRQLGFMLDYLTLIGIDPGRISAPINIQPRQSSWMYDFYARLQKHPQAYETIHRLLNRLPTAVADRYLAKMADPESIAAAVKPFQNSPDFDPSQLLFISTHSAAAVSIYAYVLQAGILEKIRLVELPPDPWTGFDLASMTSPFTLPVDADAPRHIVCTHDPQTARNYQQVRPDSNALVVALGTASAPEFLLDTASASFLPDANHWLLQWSGNPVPGYHRETAAIIEALIPEMAADSTRVTLHAMTHRTDALDLIDRLRLNDIPNFRAIISPDRPSAIKSRHRAIIGDSKFGVPSFRVAKGEGSLEFQGVSPNATLTVAAHETHDAQIGEKEFFGIFAPNTHPKNVIGRLKHAARQRFDGTLPLPMPSYAQLSLLAALDPLEFRPVYGQIQRCQRLFSQTQFNYWQSRT